jgi:hypothetical protein
MIIWYIIYITYIYISPYFIFSHNCHDYPYNDIINGEKSTTAIRWPPSWLGSSRKFCRSGEAPANGVGVGLSPWVSPCFTCFNVAKCGQMWPKCGWVFLEFLCENMCGTVATSPGMMTWISYDKIIENMSMTGYEQIRRRAFKQVFPVGSGSLRVDKRGRPCHGVYKAISNYP